MLKSSKAAVAMWAAVAVAAAAAIGGRVEARQPYVAAFVEMYPALKEKVGTAKCNTCHDAAPGAKKSARNDYGKALTEALGGDKNLNPMKNAGDGDKLKEAFTKTAEMKNADDKTFGSIIESGELPGKQP